MEVMTKNIYTGEKMIGKEEILFFKRNRYMQKPKMLQIEITNKCTLKCSQCYKDLNGGKHMEFKLLKKIIDEAKALGVKHIMLNGGEPFLHPEIKSIIEYLSNMEMYTTCYTSGLGVNDELIGIIKQCKRLEICFSLNGSCKEIHELSRDGFAITNNAIQLFKKNKIKFFINWVARHDNVDDLVSLINFAKENSAEGIVIVGNKITNDGKTDSELSEKDYEKIKTIFELDDNEEYLHIQNCFNILAQYIYKMPKSKTYGCSAGITACYITVDGKYAPCSHLNYIEEANGIQEYWDNSKYLQKLRINETYELTHCKKCMYSSKCRFCRAFSKECHDDFSKGYKQCKIFGI